MTNVQGAGCRVQRTGCSVQRAAYSVLYVALFVSVSSSPVFAQDSKKWLDSRYPYLTSSANDFPMFAVRFMWTRREEDYFSPLAYKGNLSLDAGISLKASYLARAEFRAPGLRKGWRFAAVARVEGESRFGYFGLGNNSTFDQDNVDSAKYFYRVKREQIQLQGELTRRLRKHFMVSGALGIQRTAFKRLPGSSVFRTENGDNLHDTDVTGRVSLIWDSRDNEYNTHQGLKVETGYLVGGGGDGYQRIYASISGYVPLWDGMVVAARVAGAGLHGDPPLQARLELPMWEHTIQIFGGGFTDRAFDDGRFAGRHVLFGNLEARYDLLNLETLGAITLIGFVDAGRVFEGTGFQLTKDVKWGGGGGVAIRVLRATIFTFNLAKGTEGWNFSMGSGWLF